MSDEKIIFSMAGVSKIYPPQKTSIKKHLPIILLRSEDWCVGIEWLR